MVNLVEVGLANAAVAALLAAVALIAGRWNRRPALAHALWLLVLIKLVTPPLFRLPVPGLHHPAPPVAQAAPRATPPVVARASSRTVDTPPPAAPMRFAKIEDIGKAPLPPAMPPVATPAPVPPAVIPVAAPPAVAGPEAEDDPTPAPEPTSWVTILGVVWLAGAAFWFAVALWRIFSFHRLLRFAVPAPESLTDEVRMMAAHLGLRSAPSVWIIPGHLPPLVWSFGYARLLLPAGLLERLEAPGRSALILHELAHLARRDHWVRWVEVFASCLYWWYPVAWMARVHMRAAEEEACDAWVVAELPGYGAAYAGALLDTVDFLAGRPAPLPPVASAFGGLHRLKQRLTTIIQSPAPRTVSAGGWALLLLLAVALLPITPVRGAAPPADPVPEEKPADKPPVKAEAVRADVPQPRTMPRDPPTFRDDPRAFAGVAGGQVWAVALSPDQKTIAAVAGGTSGEGAVILFDRASGKEIACVVEAKPVRCVAYSPDGKWLATGDFDNCLKLRDPRTGETKRVLKGHTGSVNALAFSGDSKKILTASLDRTLKLWGVEKGDVIRTFDGHKDWALTVALSRDGKTAVSGSKDQTARIWDVAAGTTLHTLKGHTSWVEGVALSPDGKRAATCGHDNTIRLWDVKTGKEEKTLDGHTGIVNAAAFTKDGKALVSVSHDMTVRTWDVEAGALGKTIENHHAERIYGLALADDAAAVTGSWDRTVKVAGLDGTDEARTLQPKRYSPENTYPLSSVAVSPDGKLVAACGDERSVKILDAATGSLIRLLEGHEDAVGAVTFSPDGKTLASAGFDGTVILWDPSSGKITRKLTGHTNWVFCVAFSPNGKMLASGGYDRSVRLWDVASGEPLATLTRHKGGVRAVAYHPRGGILASAGTDKSIRIWDLAKKEEVQAIKGHEDAVRALAYAPDGRLASASEDKKVRIWDAEGKQTAETALNQDVQGLALAFTPAGRLLAASDGNSVVVRDGRTLSAVSTFGRHAEAVTAVAFSADGRVMYTASKDRNVRAFPAASERRLWQATLAGHGGQMWFHQFSPDGKWVASGGSGRRLVVRPASMGAAVASVAHVPAVFAVALSPDGKTFALACHDGNIVLADAASGKSLKRLSGHKERVWGVAWSPDGKQLLSAAGSWDKDSEPGEARVWDVASGKTLHTPEGLTSRAQSAAWSPDGKWAAVAQSDGHTLVFETATWKETHTLKGEKRDPARTVSFSPDSALLAVGDQGGNVRLWEAATGKERATLKGPVNGVNCVAFSPDGATIAATSRPVGRLTAGEVWLFKKGDKGEYAPGPVLKGHKFPVLCCAWSSDGKRLASGGGMFRQPGEVVVWDMPAGKPLMTLGGHRHWVESLAFTRDGNGLMTAGGANEAGEALLWGLADGGWAVDDSHHGHSCAAWSADGKRLYTGGFDRSVRVWDVAAGKCLAEWKGAHGDFIRWVAPSPDGARVATCGNDRLVKIWDAATGEMLKALPAAKHMTMTAAWSPDGKSLAVATGDPFYKVKEGGVAVYDTASWEARAGAEWAAHQAQGAAFSPDGKWLAVGGLGADSVAVYDAVTGKKAATMKGSNSVRCVTWSRDGRRLATGHIAGGIKVWDPATGREEAEMPGHTKGILGLAFGPDGRLGSASDDGTVRSWEKVD